MTNIDTVKENIEQLYDVRPSTAQLLIGLLEHVLNVIDHECESREKQNKNMTNSEAINILKSKMDGSVDTSYEWCEAIRLAIKALEQNND